MPSITPLYTIERSLSAAKLSLHISLALDCKKRCRFLSA
jgi:hypothetical protein